MAEDVFGIVGSVIAAAYRVEAVVAEGGFGVVYRAHHVGFRAPVALKCLKIPGQLSADHQERFLEQFRAEAELLFRLSASIPAVVRPLHVDAVRTAAGVFVPFLAMEWLEGETLEAIVARRKAQGERPMSLRRLIRLLSPVARALERAHNFKGPEGPVSIVHRDLKPENIFVANVAGDQVVKVLDFGIAKAKSMATQVAGRVSAAGPGFSSFTPAYGAPEQWLPKRFGQTGPWTDVWGLALTMVETLAARPILDGDQSAMMGTAIDPERRPTPRTEGVDVSDAVEAVFERALALDPRDRYAHAGAFWDELLTASGLAEDPRLGSALRDARAEGGAIPRVEQVQRAVPLFSSAPPGSSRGEAATLDAAHLPAFAAPALPQLELEPLPKKAERTPPAAHPRRSLSPARPDVGELDVGELELSPPARRPEPARPSTMPAVTELDFDDRAPGLELALDLPFPTAKPTVRESLPPRRSLAPASPPPGEPRPAPAALRVSDHPVESARQPASHRPPVGRSVVVGPQPAHHPEPSLTSRLLPGALALLGSVMLTLADQAYAAYVGELFSIGPVRAVWVAALLMIVGILLLVRGVRSRTNP